MNVIDLEFAETDQSIDAQFEETPQEMNVFFEETQFIPGKDGASAYEIAVKNGFEGSETEWLDSLQGEQGIPGVPGRDGIDGKDGVDGKDGQPGKDGANGQPGKNGVDGKTPVKGTDYFTEADKAEMVSAVISALPKYNGEVVAE